MAEVYHVAGWMRHGPNDQPYWAAFGYYPTPEAAHQAARSVVAPGCIIIITLHGHRIATYQDGELINPDRQVSTT